jgi:beta-lactamase regulating signal transducer with metallopeptidase domain
MSSLAIRLPEMIGLTILHSLWQITLFWIVLVAVLKLWPRASSSVRYTLAILTLMLSVLATAATAVYEWHSNATSEQLTALSNDQVQAIHTAYITVKQTVSSRIIDALITSLPVLAWLWCAGLVVMGTRFAGSFFYLGTLRAKDNIAAIAPAWKQKLKSLSRDLGLRCKVNIATSTRISSPLTLGSISPIILLPTGLLSGLSTAQIEAILVHELYHIKRRDYLINICQALVEVLLFYHPAIWHINTIIREERENCCDDQTVAFCGDAITYARALTQIQEINTLTKPTLAMSVTGPNEGNFSDRIKRLFNIYPHPAQARSKGIFAVGFLIIYLTIVLTGANVSTAHTIEPKKERIKTRLSNDNTISIISSDSIPVTRHHNMPNEKEKTSGPVAGERIHSTDLQRADTTAGERTLEQCLQKVRAILKMSSIYRTPGENLRFSKLSPEDSIKLPPTTFYGTINRARMNRLDLIDTTNIAITKEEPGTSLEEFTKAVAVQVFPNSTNGNLNISFTPIQNGTHIKMNLLDSDGRMVKEIIDSSYDNIPATLHVDVSGYKKGVYILQININGATSQQRVIIE